MNRFTLTALVLTLALAACKSSQRLPVDAGQPDAGARLGLIAPVQKTDGTLDDPTTGNALGTTAHPMIVSGTIGVDTTALATASKQDTAQASLTTIAASAAGSKAAGQATMANSVPVVFASNQSSLPTTEASAAAIAASLVLLQQPTRSAAITISDSTDLTSTCTKGLYIGVGGNIAVKLAGDSSAVTKKNVPSGTYLVGAYARVMSTNTTGCTVAGDCICYYGP